MQVVVSHICVSYARYEECKTQPCYLQCWGTPTKCVIDTDKDVDWVRVSTKEEP